MVNKHKHNLLLATHLYVEYVNIDGERSND
ncbi:uncharacterized protein METZ01_LOCUS447179 [marine metagenome]|uniref:Uncharacterized protein n=1 Tax=marine metagenome TaxID=408172 RepID=A0A382ZGX1_9ZZZZ